MAKQGLILFLLLLIFGCRKDEEIFYSDDQSTEVVVDSFNLSSSTVSDFDLRADQPLQVFAGSFSNNLTGTTQTGFFTDLSIPSNAPAFGSNPQIDSIVFSIKYDAFKASAGPHTFEIYELAEKLGSGEIPVSQEISVLPTPVATKTLAVSMTDSALLGTGKAAPQLRIKMDNAYADKFINRPETSTDATFKDYFYGFLLTTSTISAGNGIVYFDPTDDSSALTIFYTDSAGNKKSFGFTTGNRTSAYIRRNRSNSEIGETIDVPSSSMTKIFLEGMGGSRLKLELPSLNKYKNDLSLINGGSLTLTNTNDFPLAEKPTSFALYYMDPEGQFKIVDDQLLASDFLVIKGDQFTFNLNYFIQRRIAAGQTELTLFFSVPGSLMDPSRIIFHGPGSIHAPELKLTYHNL